MSRLYNDGHGVERDTDKALRLLEQAALLGHETAIETMEELNQDQESALTKAKGF